MLKSVLSPPHCASIIRVVSRGDSVGVRVGIRVGFRSPPSLIVTRLEVKNSLPTNA